LKALEIEPNVSIVNALFLKKKPARRFTNLSQEEKKKIRKESEKKMRDFQKQMRTKRFIEKRNFRKVKKLMKICKIKLRF